MTPELAASLVNAFADPLKDFLVFAVVALFGALTRWALANTKNQNVKAVLEQLEHVSEVAVRHVAQTYADELKAASADGRLTASEAQLAKAKATDLVKEQLGKAWEDKAKKVFKTDDVSTLVTSHVEAAVHLVKGEAEIPVAPPAGSA